jgi:hypothetical protein
MSSTEEQLYQLRQLVALTQFYNDYTRAQADSHAFLYPEQNKELSVKSLTPTRKRKRAPSSDATKRCGNRLLTLVNNRIVDLTFPSLVLGDEHLESEEARAKTRRRGLEEKSR